VGQQVLADGEWEETLSMEIGLAKSRAVFKVRNAPRSTQRVQKDERGRIICASSV